MISAEMDNRVVNAVKYLVLNVGSSLVSPIKSCKWLQVLTLSFL